jgi:hypothetical protein
MPTHATVIAFPEQVTTLNWRHIFVSVRSCHLWANCDNASAGARAIRKWMLPPIRARRLFLEYANKLKMAALCWYDQNYRNGPSFHHILVSIIYNQYTSKVYLVSEIYQDDFQPICSSRSA